MKIARSPLMLTLALGLIASSNGLVVAQVNEHDHGNKGHEHEAMMKQEKKIDAALSKLPAEDQKTAKAQRFCPAMPHSRLGSMGAPLKLMVEGKPVFVCCEQCREEAMKGGKQTLKSVESLKDATKTLAKLPMEERVAIEAQKYCAVMPTSLLGAMGKPIKMEIDGKPVYLCCKGCTKKAEADPAGTLAKAEKLIKAGKHEGHDHKHADLEPEDHDHGDHEH